MCVCECACHGYSITLRHSPGCDDIIERPRLARLCVAYYVEACERAHAECSQHGRKRVRTIQFLSAYEQRSPRFAARCPKPDPDRFAACNYIGTCTHTPTRCWTHPLPPRERRTRIARLKWRHRAQLRAVLYYIRVCDHLLLCMPSLALWFDALCHSLTACVCVRECNMAGRLTRDLQMRACGHACCCSSGSSVTVSTSMLHARQYLHGLQARQELPACIYRACSCLRALHTNIWCFNYIPSWYITVRALGLK